MELSRRISEPERRCCGSTFCRLVLTKDVCNKGKHWMDSVHRVIWSFTTLDVSNSFPFPVWGIRNNINTKVWNSAKPEQLEASAKAEMFPDAADERESTTCRRKDDGRSCSCEMWFLCTDRSIEEINKQRPVRELPLWSVYQTAAAQC